MMPRRRFAISVTVCSAPNSVFHRDFVQIMRSKGEVESTISLLADMSTYLLERGGSVELCDENGERVARIDATQLPVDPSEIN